LFRLAGSHLYGVALYYKDKDKFITVEGRMHTVCGGWDASVKQEKDHSQSMHVHNIFAMRKYTAVKPVYVHTAVIP